jgi:hypothetical protein
MTHYNQTNELITWFLRPALLDHVKTVEHLVGNNQLKLWSERIVQIRLLRVNGGGSMWIQLHIGGGMACRRGDNNGVSWRAQGTETNTGREQGRDSERWNGQTVSTTRGSKRP